MHSSVKFLALATLLAGTTALADHPDPSQLRIQDIEYNGNGCPQGSVAANISPDAKAFTLLFDNFIAEKNTNDRRPVRMVCKVDIHLHTSSGWQFGFFSVEHRGFVDLENGLVASLGTGYQNDHHGRVVRFQPTVFRGAVSQDYQKSTEIPVHTVQWTPCSNGSVTHFTLNSDITIMGRGPANNGAGILTVDSIDGEYRQKYGFTWRKCQGGHHDDDHGDGPGHDPDDDLDDDDHHHDDGRNYAGFRAEHKLMVPGTPQNQCGIVWQSTQNGRLKRAVDECTPLIQTLPQVRREMLKQRVRMLAKSVRQEFKKWKRALH